MAVGGIGPELTDTELRALAACSARTILARHAGCYCDLCELARSIELNLTGVSHER